MSSPFNVRVRTSTGVHTLQFPAGKDTLMQELLQQIARLTKLPQRRIVVKQTGVPPTIVVAPEHEAWKASSGTLEQFNVHNRETLIVERAVDAPIETDVIAVAPDNPPIVEKPKRHQPTPRKTSGSNNIRKLSVTPTPRKRRKVVQMPGSGHRLGDGTEPEEDPYAEADTRNKEEEKLAETLRLAAGPESEWNDSVASTSAFRSLKEELQSARVRRDLEINAELRVVSAITGTVAFTTMTDGTGRMAVAFGQKKRRERRSAGFVLGTTTASRRSDGTDKNGEETNSGENDHTSAADENLPSSIASEAADDTAAAPNEPGKFTFSNSECVQLVPAFLLPHILAQVIQSDGIDAVRPLNMAMKSLRVFWALVKHFHVGPERSFGQALMECLPSDVTKLHEKELLVIDNRHRRETEKARLNRLRRERTRTAPPSTADDNAEPVVP